MEFCKKSNTNIHIKQGWQRMTQSSKWFPSSINFNEAKFLLFCLPFCGGGSSIYHSWKKELAPDVTVCPILLPGREARINEPIHQSLEGLVEELSSQIDPVLTVPYAIFGHSFGALVGFELIRHLQKRGKTPKLFFASAHRPPQKPLYRAPLHPLSASDFEEKIKEYGGTPQAILSDPEVKKMYFKILRADFTLWENHQVEGMEPLNCPIVVFAGKQDQTVSTEDLHLWQAQSKDPIHIHLLNGGHFFLKESQAELIHLITTEISSRRD